MWQRSCSTTKNSGSPSWVVPPSKLCIQFPLCTTTERQLFVPLVRWDESAHLHPSYVPFSKLPVARPHAARAMFCHFADFFTIKFLCYKDLWPCVQQLPPILPFIFVHFMRLIPPYLTLSISSMFVLLCDFAYFAISYSGNFSCQNFINLSITRPVAKGRVLQKDVDWSMRIHTRTAIEARICRCKRKKEK